MQKLSVGETRRRVCTWPVGFETERWTTLPGWIAAIEEGRLFPGVRPCPPSFTIRERAERAAATLCALAFSADLIEAQAFEGAALAA
jgi:hypothetical protein